MNVFKVKNFCTMFVYFREKGGGKITVYKRCPPPPPTTALVQTVADVFRESFFKLYTVVYMPWIWAINGNPEEENNSYVFK